ncbi:DUF3006 domain-containing protein [Shouchella patagoniensis]|uniref:DUF3006 domain-containing protein n=1 Tax=Shouchella patagoniensis TaxID=228576 RepID=UPI00147365E2|nr:DUF3006 domain-containing protein [Shouchella patagoniensis]
MRVKANLDRIEDGIATLLIGKKDDEYNLAADQLPNDALEGSWLIVEFEGNKMINIQLDVDETVGAKQRINEKKESLNVSKSKYKRN